MCAIFFFWVHQIHSLLHICTCRTNFYQPIQITYMWIWVTFSSARFSRCMYINIRNIFVWYSMFFASMYFLLCCLRLIFMHSCMPYFVQNYTLLLTIKLGSFEETRAATIIYLHFSNMYASPKIVHKQIRCFSLCFHINIHMILNY
jgi:hypothetical protein